MVQDEYRHVKYGVLSTHVAEVRLNRPERRNALTLEVLEELSHALDRAAADPDIRCVILAGEGASFCAGADLNLVHNDELGEENGVGLGAARIWEQLGDLSIPVIAAVQGHAITGGLHLAACCDLIVATKSAVFQDTHASIGLIPGSGEPQRISRRIGITAARELFLSSRRFSAREALAMGLINRVVRDDDLDEAARELASQIAGNNARSVQYLKQMLNKGWGKAYAEAQWDDTVLNWNGRLNKSPDEDALYRLSALRQGRAERAAAR